jgi:inosose dehydratase
MAVSISRRQFMASLGATAAFGARTTTRVRATSQAITFGYAAITWAGRDREAIADIAAAGYAGIQLRATVLREYAGRPAALREELARHHLTFVALSSGNLRIDPAVEAEDLATHTANARFLRDAGGLYLQIIDERPRDRAVGDADYDRLGRLLTELGKRTADVGIPLAYHHHMNSIGEPPDAIARILEASDPKFVKLLLDVAHYQQGGGDPVRAVKQYADRIALLNITDV